MKFQVIVRDKKNKQFVIGRLDKNVSIYSLPGGTLKHHSEPEDCVKKLLSEELGVNDAKCRRFKVLNRFDVIQKYHYVLIIIIADVEPNLTLKKPT